jgi:hypothetical protein
LAALLRQLPYLALALRHELGFANIADLVPFRLGKQANLFSGKALQGVM